MQRGWEEAWRPAFKRSVRPRVLCRAAVHSCNGSTACPHTLRAHLRANLLSACLPFNPPFLLSSTHTPCLPFLPHPLCCQVDLNLEIRERKTGGLSAGGGISATGAMEGAMPGVVGEVSYSQRNLFGLGQRLVASAKLGQVGGQGRVVVCRVWGEWMDRQRDAQLPGAAAVCFVKMKEASSAFLALIMLCHAVPCCVTLRPAAD